MPNSQIVIIEDERPIREGIRDALRASGYQTVEAADGVSGLAAARGPDVGLVLLDLMLPKMDGQAVLDQLRRSHPTRPVIILTARGAEEDRVRGLCAGADDYVVKPFSARELVARVQAVLRRSPDRSDNIRKLTIGPAQVDLDRREISRGDIRHSISETECALLAHLASCHGRAVSRDELLAQVWGINADGIETRTIDMHVARLRSKIEEITGEPAESFIMTVRGKGYMLGRSVQAESTGSSSG